MALRRHPVVIIKKIIDLIFIGLIPILLYLAANIYTDWLDNHASLLYVLVVLFASLVMLFATVMIYYAWMDYYLDIWIITDQRIIAAEQKGLFNRSVSELRMHQIQDVSSEVKGLLPTLLKYGSIHVQTAAEQDKFNFRQVKNPEIVARAILELHEKYISLNKTAGSASPTIPPKPAADNLPPAGK